MDAASLAQVHETLQAAVPGDSPQVVLLSGSFDAGTLATVDWLTRRHGLEISCFVLSVFRFGAERLLSIRREYPARDVAAVDPAAEVQRMLAGDGAHRRPRAGRQRPLDAAAARLAPASTCAAAAAPAGSAARRSLRAAMLLRRVRWGLAGALVAWTLIRAFGLERGWPLVPLFAFTPYVAVVALLVAGVAAWRRWWVGAARGRRLRRAAARAARAARDPRTGRLPTRRACGCACSPPTSRTRRAPRRR